MNLDDIASPGIEPAPAPDADADVASIDGPAPPPRGSWLDRAADQSGRVALGAFVAYLVLAFFLCLLVYGRRMWFAGDEWGFLTQSSLGNLSSLFAPQNGHWSTVPIIAYHVLYDVFGLHSYLPYLGVTVVLNLTLATLLRVVMRRAGVGPWVATVVAGVFVLYGTGWENILLGVQISMVGSMVFGVTHLLLADHDGPFDRRDGLGLAAGALGLMASGVGVALVAMVGVAVLVRRGWRLALVHTVPLAGLYVLWWSWQGSSEQSSAGVHTPLLHIADWIRYAESGAFLGIGHYPVVAIALGLVLVGGLILAWGPLSRPEFRTQAAAPLAMLVGGVFLIVLVATQRDALAGLLGRSLAESARESHYLSMITALTLPALGVAMFAVITRWRYSAPVLLALLLVGVPANISAMTTGPSYTIVIAQGRRYVMVDGAYSSLATQVPGNVRVDPGLLGGHLVPMSFLLQARRQGKLPGRLPESPALQKLITTRLSLGQSPDTSHAVARARCTTYDAPIIVRPRRGQVFPLMGAITVARYLGPVGYTPPIVYTTTPDNPVVVADFGGLQLRVGPVRAGASFQWCDS